MKHVKRWLAIAIIYFFVVHVPHALIYVLATFDDKFGTEMKSLTWLFPGDWEKVRCSLFIVTVASFAFMWIKLL